MRAASLPRKRGRKNHAKPLIDVLVQSSRWKARPRAAAIVQKAIAAAAKAASPGHIELAVVLTDDSGIRALNREWRKLDAPTNVLSFPAVQKSAAARSRARSGKPAAETTIAPRQLGDVVIAFETTAREAAADHKRFDHHLVHLAVHGFLHLLGYDHATARDADRMERLEVGILARLGVPDPYRARERVL
jgi:probable rRNA maturation factor